MSIHSNRVDEVEFFLEFGSKMQIPKQKLSFDVDVLLTLIDLFRADRDGSAKISDVFPFFENEICSKDWKSSSSTLFLHSLDSLKTNLLKLSILLFNCLVTDKDSRNKVAAELITVYGSKNWDYCGNDIDSLAVFFYLNNAQKGMEPIIPIVGLITRLSDKIGRIKNLANDSPNHESLQDSIKDAIVYCSITISVIMRINFAYSRLDRMENKFDSIKPILSKIGVLEQ